MVQLNLYCKRKLRAFADAMVGAMGGGGMCVEALDSALALWRVFIQPCCTTVGRVEGTRYSIRQGVMGDGRFLCSRCRIRVVYCPAFVENFCSCVVPQRYRVRSSGILGGGVTMAAKTTYNRGLCVSCYVVDQLQQWSTSRDVWMVLDYCEQYTLGQSGCVVHGRYMMMLLVPALLMFGEVSLHLRVL